jgi:hypothetical protein
MPPASHGLEFPPASTLPSRDGLGLQQQHTLDHQMDSFFDQVSILQISVSAEKIPDIFE